jgi:WD40 repeat protein
MRRTLSLLFVVVMGVAAPTLGQPSTYRAPRTETGQPDLQGVWNFDSGVPLQRLPTFGDRKSITKEEFDTQRATMRGGLQAIAKFAPIEAIGLDWLNTAPPVDDFRTSLITYPENGRLPALVRGVRRMPGFDELLAALANPQAASAQGLFAQFASFGGGTRDSYTDFMMSERCLLDVDVPLVPQVDDNFVEIIQSPDHVVLRTDVSRRLVALSGGPSIGGTVRQWTGISRGRWEGETLVVETRNFNDRLPSFAGAGTGRGKVVTERFTRTADNRIEYAAAIVDPQTFQDRVELSFPMVATKAQIFESACHEGNYSMRNALAAARIDNETRKGQRQKGPRQQVTLFDPSGAVAARVGEPGLYVQAAFSPDASQIAAIRTDIETGYQDVWVFDAATGRGRAITSDKAVDSAPLWSPDGKAIVYSSVRDNVPIVFRRAADGTGGEEQIYRHDGGTAVILTDWSRDGRFVAFWSNQGQFILPLSGPREPIAVGDGRGGRFSPDGKWFAYNTADAAQAGRFHAFVRPFGGIAWRSDSRQLFFLSQSPGQMMMTVDINGSEASAPRTLFPLPPGVGAPAQLSSINSPDGQRFVFAVTVPQK